MNPKALTIAAWLLSLGWFALATRAFLGFTPLSYVAWAVPSWLLFRRTARWWGKAGKPLSRLVALGFLSSTALLVVVVLGAEAWSSTQPTMSSTATVFDSVLRGIAVVCLIYPPVVVACVIFRSVGITSATYGASLQDTRALFDGSLTSVCSRRRRSRDDEPPQLKRRR